MSDKVEKIRQANSAIGFHYEVVRYVWSVSNLHQVLMMCSPYYAHQHYTHHPSTQHTRVILNNAIPLDEAEDCVIKNALMNVSACRVKNLKPEKKEQGKLNRIAKRM